MAEGRDLTTVVAPDADVRVLLVADPQARIARRHAEVADHADVDAVTDQVIPMDRDAGPWPSSPLQRPVSCIDSTDLTLNR